MADPEVIKHKAEFGKTTLGFWIYLMSDCLLFASLFAAFAVLRNNTAGGAGGADLFDLNLVLISTVVLLLSSLTSGLALLGIHLKNRAMIATLLIATFVLGVTFLSLELSEFNHLLSEGWSWERSAFLSAFFTLVGTHGLHILVGLIWIVVLILQLYRNGISNVLHKRLAMFSLYWHFLDLIWIFIFTIVYIFGVTV